MAEIRRIKTKEEIEKKENRNKLIIGIVLAALMLFSTAGYAFFSGDKTATSTGVANVNYNGLDFVMQGNYWQTSIQGNPFYFRYLPNETGSYDIKKTLKDYSGKPLYFTGNGVGEQEISLNLNSYVERIQLACLADTDTNCTEDIPVKNCSSNVIIIKDANFSAVREEDSCVFIFSNDTLKEADGFLYKILGVK